MMRAASRRPEPPSGHVAAGSPLLLLLLLSCCADACGGAPVLLQGLQPEQELQLWNEINDACLSLLSMHPQPQTVLLLGAKFFVMRETEEFQQFQRATRRILFRASNALEELCLTIIGTLPKPQETDEKDNTKRFLFHYSKTRKLGNSNVVSSVLHPLLQLVPQLHERRMKRFRLDEEFQGPIASQSRRYFLFRPRNGRRSEGYI